MPVKKRLKRKVVAAGTEPVVPVETLTEEEPPSRMPRGQKRIRLIHHIAQGEMKPGQLCETYGLNLRGLRDFTKANAYEIGLVKTDLENEFAGMWITQKRNRLAETEEVVNRANAQLEAWDGMVDMLMRAVSDPENADPRWLNAARALMGGRGDLRSPASDLMKVQLKALLQAAQEMGDLKQDVSLHATHLNYTIDGVNPEDMK